MPLTLIAHWERGRGLRLVSTINTNASRGFQQQDMQFNKPLGCSLPLSPTPPSPPTTTTTQVGVLGPRAQGPGPQSWRGCGKKGGGREHPSGL